jgi:ADP-ribose diphosphatase
MLNDDTVLMIYEYSGGTDRYELALTKGKIDDGETPLEAANRELIEEIGWLRLNPHDKPNFLG